MIILFRFSVSLFSICGVYFSLLILLLFVQTLRALWSEAKIIARKSTRQEVKDKLLRQNYFEKRKFTRLINKRKKEKRFRSVKRQWEEEHEDLSLKDT
jgi:hypothetical protein